MRVGVAHIEYSRRKGIERCAAELAERIAARGHEVHFHNSRCKSAEDSNVIFHNVPTWNLVNSARILTYAIFAQRNLKRANYDVTHSHGAVVGCDIVTAHSCHRAGLEIRKKLGERVLKTWRNFGVADQVRLVIERENYAKRRYRKVIAVSEGVKRELVQYYNVPERDIVVIPNGVDLNEFSPANVSRFRNETREQLGISSYAPVLIFVANEFDRKGLRFIIEALPLLRIPELKLLILGGDNKSPYLGLARKLGVENQILFLGNQEGISRFYAASDLFIFPTLYEAFSVATLEAAGTGLPLLVTRVNGTEELIRDGFNGYFIDRNPESIAEKLAFVLSDTRKLEQFRVDARKSAESYSWDLVVDKTLSVYSEVLGRHA